MLIRRPGEEEEEEEGDFLSTRKFAATPVNPAWISSQQMLKQKRWRIVFSRKGSLEIHPQEGDCTSEKLTGS